MTNRIEKTIDVNAPIETVWSALTDHEKFGAWFGVKLEQPFTPGQASRGHITYPGYDHLVMEAVTQEMQPPRYFSYTWHPYAIDPTVDYSTETPTLVEFTLASISGGTRVTVVETGFDALPEHRQPDALRMNDSGWASQVVNLKTYVER